MAGELFGKLLLCVVQGLIASEELQNTPDGPQVLNSVENPEQTQQIFVSAGTQIPEPMVTEPTPTQTMPLPAEVCSPHGPKFQPGKAYTAFKDLQPPVRLDRSPLNANENFSLLATDADEDSTSNKLETAVFDLPAYFAFHESPQHGRLQNTNSVVIYEGMSLSVNSQNGRYELAFLAEVPITAVVMNLQLRIRRADGAEGTITLAPIVFGADQSTDHAHELLTVAGATETWRVRRTGYSHVLKNAAATGLGNWEVSRHGTVQIGRKSSSTSLY
ncbi:MAG: hypothetical protein WCK86_01820 [Planctomycetia bacterium]